MLVKNENVVLRRIHGSVFLIDIADHYSGDRCALYEINETGAFLWEQLDGSRSAEDAAHLLQEALVDAVPFEVLLADAQAFFEDLKSRHFLTEVTDRG